MNKNIHPCIADWSISPRHYLKASDPSTEWGLLGLQVHLQWREWQCLCSNQICDILRKGTMVQAGSMQYRWRRVEYTIRPSLRSAEVGNKVLSGKNRITCWHIVQRKSNIIRSQVNSGDIDQLITELDILVWCYADHDAPKYIRTGEAWMVARSNLLPLWKTRWHKTSCQWLGNVLYSVKTLMKEEYFGIVVW